MAKRKAASTKSGAAKREEKNTISCDSPCPIERGMRLIGGKWKGSILWHLKQGPVRFNQLTRQLSGANRKVISDRLKEMEAHGLIHREILSERPIAVEYSLTELGKDALGVLRKLQSWTTANEI
ncbi:MAG: helix-turn-helix domain-containing protein [Planctomycetota bacterium]